MEVESEGGTHLSDEGVYFCVWQRACHLVRLSIVGTATMYEMEYVYMCGDIFFYLFICLHLSRPDAPADSNTSGKPANLSINKVL